MRQHNLHLPSNLALLLKTVVMVEGLGLNLDPEFQLTSALEPYADRLVMRKYSPIRLARSLGQASLDMARLEMPQQLRRIVNAAENGSLQVGMRPEGFEPVLNRVETIANRIVLGVITAAFINGLAVLLSVYHPPGLERWAGAAFAFWSRVCVAAGNLPGLEYSAVPVKLTATVPLIYGSKCTNRDLLSASRRGCKDPS